MNLVDPNYTTAERRKVIEHLLHHEVCNVTFTKVNGEVRVMPCTLKESLLPAKTSETVRTRPVNESTLSVWCTDKQAWRSFKIDAVTNIEIL